MSAGGFSRRRLLGAASGVVVALSASGCGGGSGRSARTRFVSESDGADADVLDALLAQEYAVLAAYGRLRPVLGAAERGLVDRIVAQERRHIAGLEVRIGQLGGRPSTPPLGQAGQPVHDRAGGLALVSRLEDRLIALYVDSLPKLSDRPTRAAAASMVANEAQHVSLLSAARGLPPVPAALVGGRA